MFIRLCWIICLAFALLVLEILLAKLSVIFPAPFILCFYLGVVYNIRLGLIAGLILTVLSEIFFARTITIMPLFILMIFFNHIWDRFGDRSSYINHAISGFLLGGLYCAYYLVGQNFISFNWYLSMPRTIYLSLAAVIATSILLPLVIMFFDSIADRMNIRQFTRERKGLEE